MDFLEDVIVAEEVMSGNILGAVVAEDLFDDQNNGNQNDNGLVDDLLLMDVL